jgi:hypothetical protein
LDRAVKGESFGGAILFVIVFNGPDVGSGWIVRIFKYSSFLIYGVMLIANELVICAYFVMIYKIKVYKIEVFIKC